MILIATPTFGGVHAKTAESVGNLLSWTVINSKWFVHESTYVANARQECLIEALRQHASHILFVDSDMVVPHDALDSLRRNCQHVVGANYARRRTPTSPTAIGLDGEPLSSLGKTGIEPVETLGFGCLLINLEVLRRLPQPIFSKASFFVGEDVAFCAECHNANIPVYVDHDVSQRVQHLTTTMLPCV